MIHHAPRRPRLDLSGYWHGSLSLNPEIDVAAPAIIERDFFIPLPWNRQIEDLRWPGEGTELSGIVTPLQNQNFRHIMRKFNEGVIVYRRTLNIARPAGDLRAVLVFEGSNYHTTVTINDQHIGAHDGGHLAFKFDITDALHDGENRIEITVDNHRRKDAAPQEQFNWQNYGGVYRAVSIEWRPRVHVAHWSATPGRDHEGWYVDVTAHAAGDEAATINVAVTSGDETQTASASHGRAVRLRFDKPRIWQPGVGGMTSITLRAGDDVVTGSFGLRTVELRDGKVQINGQPLRLLGAALHEQHATFGSSVPGWQSDYDLALMKQAGLNAVRTAHYPHAQSFYDACDRAGMLVVADLPCWQFNSYHFDKPAMRDLCCDYARDMVAQLGHHPCIVGWLIQTESDTFEPGAYDFFKAIHDTFKRADPTRFTLSAESPYPPQHLEVVKQVRDQPHEAIPRTSEFIDAFGVNNYAGWYSDKVEFFDRTLDHVHGKLGGRTMFVTEFGGEGILGQRDLTMAPWTEDYQAALITRHMRAILEREHIAGFFLWLFADYQCASIGIRAINAKGLVDEHRRPKLAFDAVRSLLTQGEPPAAR